MKNIGVSFAAILGLVVSGAVIASLWHASTPLPPLTDIDRENARALGLAHSFTVLSEGTIHYRVTAPHNATLNAPVILLVHGFQTPGFVWDEYVAPLTGAGYQVISFDNYGRGLSDRPAEPYTLERTNRLIEDLLTHLAITRPLHLVGYSMGGVTAGHFAKTHPEKIRSLTLIAPAGTGTEPWMTKILASPTLGDMIMSQIGPILSASRAQKAAAESLNPANFRAQWAASEGFEGNNRALLSTLRHYPLWSAEEIYAEIGQSQLPVQIIWGKDDSVVPFAEAARFSTLLPNAPLHAFEEIGHEITYANPELVTPLLKSFIETHRPRRVSSGLGGKARSPEGRLEAIDCLCHTDDPLGETPMPNLATPN
ncbi:MAG: alpha/beta hydrolase [Parvibaculum sp.]